MHATQKELTRWAQQRRADAQKVAKQYERQSDAVLEHIQNRGCYCNPSYTCQTAPDGSPIMTTLQMTHSLGCAHTN